LYDLCVTVELLPPEELVALVRLETMDKSDGEVKALKPPSSEAPGLPRRR